MLLLFVTVVAIKILVSHPSTVKYDATECAAFWNVSQRARKSTSVNVPFLVKAQDLQICKSVRGNHRGHLQAVGRSPHRHQPGQGFSMGFLFLAERSLLRRSKDMPQERSKQSQHRSGCSSWCSQDRGSPQWLHLTAHSYRSPVTTEIRSQWARQDKTAPSNSPKIRQRHDLVQKPDITLSRLIGCLIVC